MQLNVVTSPQLANSVSVIEISVPPVGIAIVPRAAMQAVERNRELVDSRRFGRSGIYLLIGPPGDPWRVYVGSAADILDRPRDADHWQGKEWWSRAVLIFVEGLAPSAHEQLECLVGRALQAAAKRDGQAAAAGGGRIIIENHRLPVENRDAWPSSDVRRAVLPAIEAVLHLLGVHLEIAESPEGSS